VGLPDSEEIMTFFVLTHYRRVTDRLTDGHVALAKTRVARVKMKVAADRRSQHDECPSTSVGECVAIICRRIKREVKRQLGLTNAYSHTMYIPQRQCQIVDCSLPKTSG